MNEKISKIKTHLKENKKLYICCAATAVISSGSSILILRPTQSDTQIVQKIHQIAWRAESSAFIVNLTERSTPSKPVHLVGTNLYFDSLSDAARKTGHHLSMLSKHVNGQIHDLNGDIFEVLKPA